MIEVTVCSGPTVVSTKNVSMADLCELSLPLSS